MELDFGAALTQGWGIFKQNMVAFILGTLLASILMMTVILIGPALAGLAYMGLKAYRGERVTAGDLFAGFQNVGATILLGLIAIVGGLIGSAVPVVGTFLVGGFLVFMFPVAVDKGLTVGEAVNKCFEYFKVGWLHMILLYLITSIISGLGVIACFVGVLFTAPYALLVVVAAYRQAEPEPIL